MKEIRINPFEAKKEINIGYQYDHNATKIIFDGLEEDNYYLKLQDRQTYQAFPIPNLEWIVTSTYTQQTLLTGQIFRKVDDELIAHTPVFKMNLKSSLPQSEKIKETVPPAFQTAYDEMVETTEDIKTQLENGELNGKSAYQIALDNGFVGTEQEWLDSLDYEHSDEFTQLANQVREDAQTSTQAVETVTQIKTDVEDTATEFEQTVQNANDDFDNKVNQANSDLDTKIQQANATIDEKVTEATNQATKAKEEADRATLATDGKLDKNQGTDNVGKVMVVGEDGELTPTEYKSGSDNKLIGTVAKSENPNITDGYQAEMMNLKLYGKSTQATTAGKNLFDVNAVYDEGNLDKSFSQFGVWLYPLDLPDGTYTFTAQNAPYTKGGYLAIGVYTEDSYLVKGWIAHPSISQKVATFELIGNKIIVLSNSMSVNETVKNEIGNIQLEEGSTVTEYEPYTGGQPSPSPEYPQPITAISQFNGNIRNSFQLFDASKLPTYTQGGATVTNNVDGTWEPFDSNPQELSYTPTNPMYSTQDGSICDYVDVEKGVEVYNMSGEVVFDGSESGWELWDSKNGYTRFNYMLKDAKNTLSIFCNKLKTVVGIPSEYTQQVAIEYNDNTLRIIISNDNASTLEQLKIWLSQNPITVVYQLATPTETPISQEQLAVLKALYTYNGVTNLLCNAPVSFDYEQSLQIVIQNIWNAIGQTNANILLNGGNQ